MAKHHERSSVYEEIDECIKLRKDSESKLRIFENLLRNEFVDDYNLYLSGVIFRNHNNDSIIKFSKMIFDYILSYTKRDQILIPFVRQKQNLHIENFNMSYKPMIGNLCIYGTIWNDLHKSVIRNEYEYNLFELISSLYTQLLSSYNKMNNEFSSIIKDVGMKIKKIEKL